NVDPWKLINHRVDLSQNDSLPKCRRFNNDRRVFGIWSGVEISLCIALLGTDKRHVRSKVYEHSCVKFGIRMNRSKLDLAILQKLRDPKTLRPGVGQINFARDSFLKQVQVFGPANAGDQEMEIVNSGWINSHQSP